MHRDMLKSIKEFFYLFQNMSCYKITQKALCDGYLFMQFLSNVDCNVFDTGELSKCLQVDRQRKFMEGSLLLGSNPNPKLFPSTPHSQLDLPTRIKNWKTVIRKIKHYFLQTHEKGVKYGDIDIVDICKNESLQQLSKMFQLVLCVVANCEQKDEFIGRIMSLEETTQNILATHMQTALEGRLCTMEVQYQSELIEELQQKEQENVGLYTQLQRLQQANSQLQERIEEYEKSAKQIEYERQKILRFNKKNSMLQQLDASNSSLANDRSCNNYNNYNSPYANQNDQSSNNLAKDDSCWEDSVLQGDSSFCGNGNNSGYYQFSSGRGVSQNIVDGLKQRLIREEDRHQQEVEELYGKIEMLEEQVKQGTHFQQLLIIYQQKYQQALAYVQKVTLYQKQKNKLYEQIMQRDLIIEELKESIGEVNQRLLEVEQEKIDLELLLAKRNCERMVGGRRNNGIAGEGGRGNANMIGNLIGNNNNDTSQLDKTSPLPLPTLALKRQQTSPHFSPHPNNNLSLTHPCQTTQDLSFTNHPLLSKISLKSLYPNNHDFDDEQNRSYQLQRTLQQLRIKTQQQLLQIKRLQRKELEMGKRNSELKTRLERMRKVESENKKLQAIVVEMHTRKDQEQEVLVGCLYETFVEYDFRFHKLIGLKSSIMGGVNAIMGGGNSVMEGGHKANQASSSSLNDNGLILKRADNAPSRSHFSQLTNTPPSPSPLQHPSKRRSTAFNTITSNRPSIQQNPSPKRASKLSSESVVNRRKERRNPSIAIQQEDGEGLGNGGFEE